MSENDPVIGPVRGPLRDLCELMGVETSFHGVDGRVCHAGSEAVVATLAALGASLARESDARDALRARRESIAKRLMEPVVVSWDGSPCLVPLAVSEDREGDRVRTTLALEDGGRIRSENRVSELPPSGADRAGAGTRALSLTSLPYGYHRLAVEIGGERCDALVISAPSRCYDPERDAPSRQWGVFAPTDALLSRRGGGAGDLSELGLLIERCADLGGRTVATLPLLPRFLSRPEEPSPYSPVSRLFWSELCIPVERLSAGPDVAAGGTGAASLADEALGTRELIDYAAEHAWRWARIERAASSFFSHDDPRRDELETWRQMTPHVDSYAAYRARVDTTGRTWREWTDQGASALEHPDAEAARRARTHLFAAWLAECAIDDLGRHAARRGTRLYLDLPLGVHPGGFDAWRERELFATGARVGAPPDKLFAHGQDWGFPPLHPERLRGSGFRHLVEVLRHHTRPAGLLRLDHVMSLRRLFWIPDGFDAESGVYVRYPMEELCAVVALESHRQRCMIVGEDLGIVPDAVREAMRRHGLLRMHVAQLELRTDESPVLPEADAHSVASLNTHDTPTFAGFLAGRDIDERAALGLIDETAERDERATRARLAAALSHELFPDGTGEEDRLAWLAAALRRLARGPARLVLVSVEDLALETDSRNVPGVGARIENWRRRMSIALEDLFDDPGVRDLLRSLAR